MIISVVVDPTCAILPVPVRWQKVCAGTGLGMAGHGTKKRRPPLPLAACSNTAAVHGQRSPSWLGVLAEPTPHASIEIRKYSKKPLTRRQPREKQRAACLLLCTAAQRTSGHRPDFRSARLAHNRSSVVRLGPAWTKLVRTPKGLTRIVQNG